MLKNWQLWVTGMAAGVLAIGCTSGGLSSPGAANPPANRALLAKLQGAEGGAQGSLAFEDQGEHRELAVEITGGQPGETLELSVNGMVVLSVTLDDAGNAHLQFDSNPDESGEAPLPTEFPAITAGDAVGVGELSGNFQQEDDGDVGDTDDGDVGDTDDGAVGDADDGAVGDTDDGAIGDTDDGAADDMNDGDINDSTP